jgi:hypothetical protein
MTATERKDNVELTKAERANMTRNQLVDRCKAIIAEAYTEATEMIVAFLEKNPGEKRATICREIDPENWRALESRVMRLQKTRRSEGVSGITTAGPTESQKGNVRGAKAAIRKHPELVTSLLSDPSVKAAVEAELPMDTDDDETKVRKIAKHNPAAVGKVAGETPAALKAAIDEGSKTRSMSPEGKARAERTREKIELAFLPVGVARKMLAEIRTHFAAWHVKDRDQAEGFLRYVEESAADMRLSMEASVSDDDIAAFMDSIT